MWIVFDLLTRLVIGGSLVIAGLTKLLSTVSWRQVWLASYRLLPRPLVRPVAVTLPSAEACCGLAVLAGVLGPGSALAGAGMLAVLAAAVAAALLRGLEITCHCLTMTGEVISWRGVARNLVLAAAAVLAVWRGGSWRGAADLLGSTRLGWPAQLGLLAAGALVAHAAALAVTAARRQRTLTAIASRLPVTAAQQG
ncbi:MAG TPA: MauE/DoxX family redox-associated membrane protein [Streptosporangiaceae bacterium]|jgi:hypothetical protein|nr:MauE/DoxX family redox-associated membrane protein [Streptosporangiaceae bacterium]